MRFHYHTLRLYSACVPWETASLRLGAAMWTSPNSSMPLTTSTSLASCAQASMTCFISIHLASAC